MNHSLFGMLALLSLGCTTREAAPPPASASPGARPPSLGSTVQAGADVRGGANGKGAAPALSETVEYWDGATRRKLWLSENLVAEFEPGDAGREAVRAQDPAAEVVEQPQKSVRLWRLSAAAKPDAVAKAASGSSLRLSVVLHDGPSPDLPMRALPGGVLATFPTDWDRAKIDAWLGARGLHVQGDAVVAAANMMLVATAPGLDAIRVADELHATGELVDAEPNFWMQNVAK